MAPDLGLAPSAQKGSAFFGLATLDCVGDFFPVEAQPGPMKQAANKTKRSPRILPSPWRLQVRVCIARPAPIRVCPARMLGSTTVARLE